MAVIRGEAAGQTLTACLAMPAHRIPFALLTRSVRPTPSALPTRIVIPVRVIPVLIPSKIVIPVPVIPVVKK